MTLDVYVLSEEIVKKWYQYDVTHLMVANESIIKNMLEITMLILKNYSGKKCYVTCSIVL